jgi:hypothetical protein
MNFIQTPAKGIAAAVMLGLLSTTAANASQLNFTNLTAAWIDPVGGDIVSNNSPTSSTVTATINWGDSGGVSGYDFTFLADPVPNPAATADNPFNFGTFVHRNQPITAGTAITSVTLRLSGDIFIDSNFVENTTYDFLFTHDETPNTPGPCPYGDGTPCGDGVTVSALSTNDTFTLNGVEYTLSILGFIPEGGSTPSTFFFSDEELDNSATLQAVFTEFVPPNVIPLPAAAWMLLAGIGGLAAVGRRKKRADA